MIRKYENKKQVVKNEIKKKIEILIYLLCFSPFAQFLLKISVQT